MLHDKSKQVGLGRRMVCDAACFPISDKSTTTDIATDDRASTCTETEAAVNFRGPLCAANGVLGWAVSIKAGGQPALTAVSATPDTRQDRPKDEIRLFCDFAIDWRRTKCYSSSICQAQKNREITK